jgi:hypothetical protein
MGRIPTVERPLYARERHEDDYEGTALYLITCDEGWRQSIVATHMYGHVAEWLVDVLQGRPFPKP